jgi:hypothetical protein
MSANPAQQTKVFASFFKKKRFFLFFFEKRTKQLLFNRPSRQRHVPAG